MGRVTQKIGGLMLFSMVFTLKSSNKWVQVGHVANIFALKQCLDDSPPIPLRFPYARILIMGVQILEVALISFFLSSTLGKRTNPLVSRGAVHRP